MKLLSSVQVKAWDKFTIDNEPVTESDLMERAAAKAASFISGRFVNTKAVYVFCGKGNNGGDGLVISRLLLNEGYRVYTIIIEYKKGSTPLFCEKLSGLKAQPAASIQYLEDEKLPDIEKGSIIIDAIFGTALRLPLPETVASLLKCLNELGTGYHKISIDIPSGLQADFCRPPQQTPFKADTTLTFQVPKCSFLLADTGLYCGRLVILDIGLDPEFLREQPGDLQLSDFNSLKSIFKARQTFAHKGTYGHSLIIAGSKGKTGAAVLSTKACVHAGAGLVTVFIPQSALNILQISVPEAMAIESTEAEFSTSFQHHLEPYNAIGVGPGLGQHPETKTAFLELLATSSIPLIIDADALNILAGCTDWEQLIPPGSILTPHPGEFDRLTGKSATALDRLLMQQHLALKTKSVIILKGAYTSVCLPNGETWFNTTGNPGMATGGSGDTLTGILTALRSQGYSAESSSRLGVFIHGLAADLATETYSQISLSAGLIIDFLGKAFLKFEKEIS